MANEGSSIGGAIAIAVGVLFIYMALRRMIFMVRRVACVGVCVPHCGPPLRCFPPSHRRTWLGSTRVLADSPALTAPFFCR
jgi:hypothetical protein